MRIPAAVVMMVAATLAGCLDWEALSRCYGVTGDPTCRVQDAGCADSGHLPDAIFVAPVDLSAVTVPQDLGSASDLATPRPDVSTPLDFSVSPDLAGPVDLLSCEPLDGGCGCPGMPCCLILGRWACPGQGGWWNQHSACFSSRTYQETGECMLCGEAGQPCCFDVNVSPLATICAAGLECRQVTKGCTPPVPGCYVCDLRFCGVKGNPCCEHMPYACFNNIPCVNGTCQ